MRTTIIRILLLFLGLAPAAWAVPVQLTLPSGIVVLAHYLPGADNKPAVLLLHGFLQTYEFPTLHRLAEGLAGEGYTVLAPNLSLGVTHRRQSLACEAIHTHTLEQDGREVGMWIQWLRQRHKGPIVLLGHSIGGMALLAYLAEKPRAEVNRFIGVSLVEGGWRQGDDQRQALLAELRTRIAQGDRRPVVSQYSFCQKLTSTPESLLSYLSWTPEHILRVLRGLRTPTTLIMGGSDERLGPDWLERLRKTTARLVVIRGADHFMDGEHEFDLLDEVIRELRGL